MQVKYETPKVGETILLRHRSKVNKAGDASMEATKPVVDTIYQVMLDGDVKTKSGDLWKVVKSPDSKAKWATTAVVS